MTSYDAEIGIVGAGPAGARAAELLAGRGVHVAVWDPRIPWEKPCGGGLPASAFDQMPELRELLPTARRIDAVRFESSSGHGFAVELARSMYMVSRRDLARFQVDRAQRAGAEWIQESIRRITPRDGGSKGWLLEGSEDRSWAVRRIVGADGAASLTRRSCSPDLQIELAPTRVAYPVGVAPDPDTVLVRLFAEVDGYFWDFSRPDHRSVGAGVEAGTWNRRRLDDRIDRYLGLGRTAPDASDESNDSRETKKAVRPDAFSPRAGAVIGTAALGHGSYDGVGASDFALVGDAAGFADPATGEGIQNALLSARYLADSWDPTRGFADYPAAARAGLEPAFKRSRVLRRVLFQLGVGEWLVDRGKERRWARALVSGVMNSTNEHDLTVSGLLRRTRAALGNGSTGKA